MKVKYLCKNFWYDYIKQKDGGKAKLCYTDTDSFIIYIMTRDFLEDISNDVQKWYDRSNYDENDKRPLPISQKWKSTRFF